MKQIIINVLILIVCIGTSYAEPKDSNEYRKLTKSYITEVIHAAMISCEEASSSGKLKEAENKGMIKFKESYYSSTNWEYNDLYVFLKKNSWGGIANGFFQDWKGIIKNDSIDYESNLEVLLSSVVVCPYKAEKIPEIFELKVSIIQTDYEGKLEEIYKNNNQIIRESESNQFESRSQDRIDGYQENTSSLDFLHYLLFILVLASSFFCFRFYKEKENVKGKCRDLKLKIKDYEASIFQNGSRKKEVNKTSRKVVDKKGIDVLSNDELKNTSSIKNGNSHDDYKPKSQVTQDLHVKVMSEQPVKTSPKVVVQEPIINYKSTQLYFEEFEDGAFVVRSARKQKSSWSVFCISTTAEKEGNLELLYRDMAQEIITNKEMYLGDTICEVTYQAGGNMNKILSATAGKVRLDGNKWIVTEKVRVTIN